MWTEARIMGAVLIIAAFLWTKRFPVDGPRRVHLGCVGATFVVGVWVALMAVGTYLLWFTT